MDTEWKIRMAPPLPLLVLGALTPECHRVTLADENTGRIALDDQPDLVGITVKADTAQRSFEIAQAYRSRGIPVVMGGIHPTACPEHCAAHADALVIGEAERVWADVLNDLSCHRLQPEYRDENPVDMATVPIPRWSMIRDGRYLFTNTITISRGCPYRCDFCYNSSPNIHKKYRWKPIENIVREIESLDVPHVMFIDDNFVGNPSFTHQLLPHLKRLNITWHAAVCANIGQYDDLLDRMAESGCKSLFIGFETVNAANLTCSLKTQNRIASYDDTVRKIHTRGMMVNASMVFGFDHDDTSTFPAALDWLVRNRIETMTAHILTPYPGTVLHRKLKTEGRIIDDTLSNYNTSRVVYRPKGMSPEALEEGYRWMYRTFYSWENIWRRLPESRSQRKAYLQFNLFYRKFGRLTAPVGTLIGMRRSAKLAKALAYPHRGIRGQSSTLAKAGTPLRWWRGFCGFQIEQG